MQAAIAFPNIDPVALRLGPLAVHWYGVAYLVAFISAVLIARWLGRRWSLGFTDDDLLTIMMCAIVGVMAGGRLGYVLVYGGSTYWKNPAEILAIWDGGMSFHGGLLGIMAGGLVAARLLKMSWLTLCDLGSVGAPVGFLFGRLANFVNGELWGRPTDVAWGMVFPGAGDVPRHPSQLYEAGLEGALLLSVMVLLAMQMPPRPRGELLGWLLTLYGVFRTLAEFFRQPDVQMGFLPGGVTTGQLLSVPMIAAGVWIVWWSRKRGLPHAGPTVSRS